MTTDQLNQARAQAWRQAGNPLLTADDAAAWLRETGVCLFLPRPRQLATAAPSFVEATLGAPNPTPERAAIESANQLLYRLLGTGDAMALNLMGTATPALPGEQPDFLATPETLPFLFALIGDKEWKRGPRGKSSPLTIEVWKLLGAQGPLTAEEVKDKLGRQLTEAAALRALSELWSHLRIEPLYAEGEPARWQLLEHRHQKQMQAGSTLSLAVALSALVSLYLQSAVAASEDEIGTFLSPLASRSKVRDAVKGLTATRQLATLNLGPVELFHVEGSLPEFPEIARPEGAVVEDLGRPAPSEPENGEGIGEGRRRFVAGRIAASEASASTDDRKPRKPRQSAPERAGRSAARPVDASHPARPAASQDRAPGERRPFTPRPAASRTEGSERRPYGTRGAAGKPGFNPREPWKEDRKPARGEAEEGERPRSSPRPGERKPFQPRQGAPSEHPSSAPRSADRPFRGGATPTSDRKPFAPRGANDRKPFSPRKDDGERRSFTPRESGPDRPGRSSSGPGDRRPYKARPDAGSAGERKGFGARKPFSDRSDGDRKPYSPREAGGSAPARKPFTPREGAAGKDRKPFAPRSGDRPFKPRADAKPFSDRKPFTPREGAAGKDRKPFAPRSGDRPFKPRADAKPFSDRKPFTPREGAAGKDRKPFTPRSGDRPFKPRADARPFSDRKASAGRKPFSTGKDAPPADRRPSPGGPPRPASAGRPARPAARKTTGAPRTRTSSFTSSGKPRAGARSASGRPGPRATRGSAAKAFKRPGRPGKGPAK